MQRVPRSPSPLIGGFLFLLFLVSCTVQAETRLQAAVASAHPLATEAGTEILAAGGNAFDAAVAVSAVLAVVEPYGSGLGGGGFWLLHEQSGREVMLDGREKAPLKAHRDLYLDDQGNVIPGLSVDGALAAGIPGTPAALVHLAEKYGSKPLGELLEPAIRLAQDGFPADEVYRRYIGFRIRAIQASPDATAVFLRDGNVPEDGELIVQKDLAKTLTLLAQRGSEGFYDGDLAKKLVTGVQQAGGIWTLDDLKQYRVVEREPIRFYWAGMHITSAAPPSSGGIAMATILNQLEGMGLSTLERAERIHWITEAMRRAYRDRAQYLGDEDFVAVPKRLLTSKAYAAGLRQSIRSNQATPSKALAPTQMATGGGQNTTHFSVVDHTGNRVAATMSINYPFGSGFVPQGTGVLLNDEMDDFSAKPGEPNVYGLVGAAANAIEPGKRMLSSMTPTFVEKDGRVAVMGTPGGSRIITMVTLGILGFYDGLNAQQIVDLPRFHHQYLPDRIQFEPGQLDAELRDTLEAKGHTLHENGNAWGNMQLVIQNTKTGVAEAASDGRGIGSSLVLP